MIYLLLIIVALALIVIFYVPQLATVRARLVAGLAAIFAAIASMIPDVQGWIASLFGG